MSRFGRAAARATRGPGRIGAVVAASTFGILLALPPTSSANAAAASPAGGASANSFAVPAAAVSLPLGQIAPGPCPAQGAQYCAGYDDTAITKGNFPMDVTGLGVPVGGVGAGSFMINQAGTFGPWNFGGSQDSAWEMRILPQAAFHFREQLGSAAPTVRTLATDGPSVSGPGGPVPLRSWGSPLPAWHTLAAGQGTTSMLYPFGWTHYSGFRSDVSMRFFSPIVARQDRDTSLPVVHFDVRLANPTGQSDAVSVMFTMPNAPGHVGATPATVREGLTSRVSTDKATGVEGVTLGADSPANTPDARNSEWTVATRAAPGQQASYTTSWNAAGDGSDVYAPFSSSGTLPDAAIDSSHSAGAVALSARLGPGQATTLHFTLSWDFPEVGFNDNQTVWMRRYTDFYGARETAQNSYVEGSYPFHQSFRIADDALADERTTLAAVTKWWAPIATSAAYPLALRTAALNQLYQLAFNSSFWEGGLVSNTVTPTKGRRLGSVVPGTHIFDTIDSTVPWTTSSQSEVNYSNEMDVDSYGYLAYDDLFPNLERDRLAAHVQATLADPYGDPAQGRLYVVRASSDPFITWDQSAPPSPGATTFVDVPAKTILRLYAYAHLAHDARFLRASYPAMRKALTYLQALVPAGEHLPSPRTTGANTYDVIPVNGYDVYDSQLYVLALEMVIAAGRQLGVAPGTVAPLRADLAGAKAQLEALFWDPVHQAYRYTVDPSPSDDSILLDTFFAEHAAQTLGLPDVVSPAHLRTQLLGTYARFMGNRDANGLLLGAPNMVLAPGVTSWPLVGPAGPFEETEVWSGTDYFVASTYYMAGQRAHDATLRREGIQMGTAIAAQIWRVPANGFIFDAPEAWRQDTTLVSRYPAYARPLAVWDLIEAIKPTGAASG